ncbi:MAG: phytanoyl-CoA dioxygenase, partial [Myxococcaceae bacterium]|nr:phytanoyl-CoA dioxygenase [Myxococcaceae bacterium]
MSQHFIDAGWEKLEGAFPRALADQARAMLWKGTGCDPDDPSTWSKPVVRLGNFEKEPFLSAASTPALRAAFDRLVGAGRWRPCQSVGTFPIRFPSAADPGDAGWHVDMSFGGDPADFLSWRVNVSSKGRALLMLFLFSDVGPDDAPTRIRSGSHVDVARALAAHGAEGLSLRELVDGPIAATAGHDVALAT